MNIDSHNKLILDYLSSGKSITPLEALNMFGCFRLSARINDLRNVGHPIKTTMVTINNKRLARYSI